MNAAIMDDFIVKVYCQELATQCRFALNAIRQINAALTASTSRQSPSLDQALEDNPEVFRGIHSFLTHASNVSRILWPPGPRKRNEESQPEYKARQRQAKERGLVLRAWLGIPNDKHSMKDRTLRDHLEHVDERLDDWQATSSRRMLLQDYIGPPDGIEGIEPRDRMRSFDPKTRLFHFRGHRFNIQSLATAIDQLLPVVIREAETYGPSNPEDRDGD